MEYLPIILLVALILFSNAIISLVVTATSHDYSRFKFKKIYVKWIKSLKASMQSSEQ